MSMINNEHYLSALQHLREAIKSDRNYDKTIHGSRNHDNNA